MAGVTDQFGVRDDHSRQEKIDPTPQALSAIPGWKEPAPKPLAIALMVAALTATINNGAAK